LHELYTSLDGPWDHADLTKLTGAPPPSAGELVGITGWDELSKLYVYLDQQGHIQELSVSSGAGAWNGSYDVTAHAQVAAAAAGTELVVFAAPATDSRRPQLVYLSLSPANHVMRLSYFPPIWVMSEPAGSASGGQPLPKGYVPAGWGLVDLSASVGAPSARRELVGFWWDDINSEQCAFVDGSGAIQELYQTDGGVWRNANLSVMTGAAPFPGRLFGYQESDDLDSKQYAYIDQAGHLQELYVVEGGNWALVDLTATAGAPPAAGTELVGYYSDSTESKQYAYFDAAGHLHELYVVDEGKWDHADLTAATGAPPADTRRIVGFEWPDKESKQYAYLDPQGHVQELYVIAGGNWDHADLTKLTGAPPARV
jgi:hypothetical protein